MNLFEIAGILTEKVPDDINLTTLKEQITSLDAVDSIEDIKVWSINSNELYAVMRIYTQDPQVKDEIREILAEINITQAIIECSEPDVIIPVFTAKHPKNCGCGHHHHHFPRIPTKR